MARKTICNRTRNMYTPLSFHYSVGGRDQISCSMAFSPYITARLRSAISSSLVFSGQLPVVMESGSVIYGDQPQNGYGLTGSHPAVAGKSSVLYPGLLPVVKSFGALAPVEYKNGFRKPSTGFPAPTRRSFSSETTLAKTGLEHGDGPETIPKLVLAAATTGKPRPEALNSPPWIFPS